VTAPCAVVGDKLYDLLLQIVGALPDNEIDPFLAGSMMALDLSVRLRMIRRGEDMPHQIHLEKASDPF